MLAFDKNPYRHCGDNNITSSVVALEVKRSNGSKLSIKGLEKEIDIRIHHKERPFVSDQENFVLQIYEASSQFHTFENSFSDVAVAIEFFSHNETVLKWKIMVAHGKRPTVRDNLASWTLDGRSRELYLLESRLLTSGTYYIQVEALSKVPTSSEEEISANVSYSLKTSKLKCLFWVEELEGWSLDGCRVSVEEYMCFFNFFFKKSCCKSL